MKRNPHRSISANMVDWAHHHTGGKSSPPTTSNKYQSYSYDEVKDRDLQDEIENGYEIAFVSSTELNDNDECGENQRNEVIERRNPKQDDYDYDIRNDMKEVEQDRNNLMSQNSKSVFASDEYEPLPRAYKKANEETLNSSRYPGHRSQYATLTQMRNHICLPLPPTLVNHSTQYDLEELSMSQSDHTDTGTHSTSHLQQQVPIPVPILNRSTNGIKSPNQSPSRIIPVASTDRQSSISIKPKSPLEKSESNSPHLSHSTYSPSKTVGITYHGGSIDGSVVSNISKYPDTPDGLRRKQIYENVLKYTENPNVGTNNFIDNLGEFKHLDQLLNEAGDSSIEVQRLKTVMRTIMLRRKESLKLLQSSIASSE